MSATQRARALEQAHMVRAAESELKRRLRAGEMSLMDALELPEAQNVNVWRLLKWLPYWGTGRLYALSSQLERERVPVGFKRVRMLTVRQRLALIAAIDGHPRGSVPGREIQPAPRPASVPVVQPRSDGLSLSAPPRCGRCRLRMRERVPEGLCGFCIEELREAA